MIRRPPRSTRTDTLFPYTTLFRSMPADWASERTMGLSMAPGATALTRMPYWPFSIAADDDSATTARLRSEEHTSELQSLMRISYAVFCLKKKKNQQKEMTTKSIQSSTILMT